MSKIKGTGAGIKFLISAFRMVKNGDIKTEQQLLDFAKQQFGDNLDLGFFNQIKSTFKKAKAAQLTDKRTKDIAKGDPMGEESGLMKRLRDKVKEIKKLDEEMGKDQKGMFDNIFDAMIGFRKPMGSKDAKKPFRTPGMPFQKENPDYRLPGGSMYAEGNLRTAIRQFLKTELDAGNIKLNEKDAFRVKEYSPMSEDDPIDVFRRYYGEDALQAADDMAKELEQGTSFKDYENIFRKNMPELKIKTEGAGEYDPIIKQTEEVLKQAEKEKEYMKTLDDFDIGSRKKNMAGGINRVGYAKGKIKLIQFLAGKGKDLTTEIRRAVNNIFESGDRKLDADMAIDDMFDELGVDRDVVDQKDVMKAYDEAYKTLSVPPGSRGGPEDIAEPFQSAEESTGNLMSKQLKVMRLAEDIEPGLFEKLSDTQLEIIAKYGDMIDDNLLRQIVLDKDPNNQALALAQIEEAKVMIDKGMDVDEILRIQGESLNRKKQAEGGLSYLMGM